MRCYFRALVLTAALATAVLAHPVPLQAQERVWTGIVLATNDDSNKAIPPELAKYAVQLEDIFGYDHFTLMGSHTEVMDDPSEKWLLPSKNFSLKVSARPAKEESGAVQRAVSGRGPENPNSIYDVKLELYHEKRQLVQTNLKLATQSPIFIRGPLYGEGQLIFVLLIKPGADRTRGNAKPVMRPEQKEPKPPLPTVARQQPTPPSLQNRPGGTALKLSSSSVAPVQ